jgi:hypothetical protein
MGGTNASAAIRFPRDAGCNAISCGSWTNTVLLTTENFQYQEELGLGAAA